MKTNKDITGNWFDHEEMTIPKGTRVTNESACGKLNAETEGYFIADLNWVPKWENGLKMSGFLHDATYIGIRVSNHDVDLGEVND